VFGRSEARKGGEMNAKELRERYINELRQNEENLAMGLAKEGDASDSEEEERIYEVVKKNRQKS
jgi:hypothetical protein